jgi:mono/diheme cytochrome c family protein
MSVMFTRVLLGVAVLSVAAVAADDKVERGRYLVEEVGKCQECHTPMNEKGELDRTKWLKGATLNFAPINPVPGWHKTAPDLTSQSRLFERWKEEGLVKFMNTGLNPKGGKADAPMPTYKMTKEDAEAVVAYLKSLQ